MTDEKSTNPAPRIDASKPWLPVTALAIVALLGLALWFVTASSENNESAGSSTGAAGTIDLPFPLDEPHTIATDILQTKGVADWAITISSLSEADFTPTQEGVAFASFSATAELQRTEQEPVTTLESFDFEIFGGATSTVYDKATLDQECVDADDTFDPLALVSERQAVVGNVCIAIPAADLNHPDTLIAVRFNLGELAYFG